MLSTIMWRAALRSSGRASSCLAWRSFSATVGEQITSLADVRAVIRLQGEGVVHFLQVRWQWRRCRLLLWSPACFVSNEQLSKLAAGRLVQGLVTNDVGPLERAGAHPLYACILNAQGRYLHDMLLFRTDGEMAGRVCHS